MANKKFSEFDLKTASGDVAFVVGYNGTDNVRIAPSDLSSGGGATDLNGLSDCNTADGSSVYVGNVPSGLSGSSLNNTVLGNGAGNSIVGGFRNTLIGKGAGSSINHGDYHVCIGIDAGASLTNANETVCIGRNAGGGSTATDTVIIGSNSGRNASSTGHVSIGYQAGFSQTSATANTFIGFNAGYGITTDGYNTVIGYQAMNQSEGTQSTYIGFQAGQGFNTGTSTANNNIAIGHQAMSQRRGGSGGNVVVGNYAYKNTDGGYENVVIGYSAVPVATSGRRNVVLGSGADLGAGNDNESVVLGYSAAGNGSNTVTLGNTNVTGLHCQVQTISALSDARDKTSIETSSFGLDLISKLNPVTFEWAQRDGKRKGLKDLGFIAQELQEFDNESLQLVNSNNPEKLQASYGRLIPVLVKAIQELKSEIELLKS